jgi:hypothetical protein
MPTLQDVQQRLLTRPTPAALVELQGVLLSSGRRGEAAERCLELAGEFHAYLCELESKLSAQQYSELASRLDMGAVGLVAIENLAAGDREKLWQRLLLGLLGEGLMVAASRQYIRAWQVETGVVHQKAAWTLAQALWQSSSEMQPDLAPGDRWQAIRALLAPAYDPAVVAPNKALLLGRIFQLLLVACLGRLSSEGVQGGG